MKGRRQGQGTQSRTTARQHRGQRPSGPNVNALGAKRRAQAPASRLMWERYPPFSEVISQSVISKSAGPRGDGFTDY
jgi:hypothetical protein